MDQPPQFPDGDAALMKFIMTNLHYPEKLTENPQGRIVVQFVVNKDGSIGDVIIRNSVDEELEKEIIRIVKSLPKFLPGRQNDHPQGHGHRRHLLRQSIFLWNSEAPIAENTGKRGFGLEARSCRDSNPGPTA